MENKRKKFPLISGIISSINTLWFASIVLNFYGTDNSKVNSFYLIIVLVFLFSLLSTIVLFYLYFKSHSMNHNKYVTVVSIFAVAAYMPVFLGLCLFWAIFSVFLG